MLEIKHNSMAMDEAVHSSKTVGRRVFAKNGDDLGKVKELAINPEKMRIEGVWVSPCFTCVDEYIGREYVDKITEEGVMLKIDPLTEVIGEKVFDSQGKKIGKVSALTREKKTNSIISLEVDRGIGKDRLIVPIENVKSMGNAVILSKKVEAK